MNDLRKALAHFERMLQVVPQKRRMVMQSMVGRLYAELQGLELEVLEQQFVKGQRRAKR